MTKRRALPPRRHCVSFELAFGGLHKSYAITVGYYEDDRTIGEIFINGGKSGEAVEGVARDGAVLCSLALQHGATLETLSHAITRDQRGQPTTVIGAVIDRLIMMSTEQPIL